MADYFYGFRGGVAKSPSCKLYPGRGGFTKYAHFLPLSHPFTASVVAKLFMNQVYRLHGLPSVIATNIDRVFTSSFWKELFRLAGVELHMSTSYHPQSDGHTERLIQTMETFFAVLCQCLSVQMDSLASLGRVLIQQLPSFCYRDDTFCSPLWSCPTTVWHC